MPDPSITEADARALLRLPRVGVFSSVLLAGCYRARSKELHPDAGGSHEQMARLNAARDLLAPLAVAGWDEPRQRRNSFPTGTAAITLTIGPDAVLVGPGGVVLGRAPSIAAMERFCRTSGWDYRVARDLPSGQAELPKKERAKASSRRRATKRRKTDA